jgi:excisionase family DNA binding protein
MFAIVDQPGDNPRLSTSPTRRPPSSSGLPSHGLAFNSSQRRAQPEPHLTASDVMTATEVAALLGVPTSTVHHWARDGTIPSRKLGKRRIFIRPKIEALLLEDGR